MCCGCVGCSVGVICLCAVGMPGVLCVSAVCALWMCRVFSRCELSVCCGCVVCSVGVSCLCAVDVPSLLWACAVCVLWVCRSPIIRKCTGNHAGCLNQVTDPLAQTRAARQVCTIL